MCVASEFYESCLFQDWNKLDAYRNAFTKSPLVRNHQFLKSTFLGHPLGHFRPDLCALIAGGGAAVAIKTVYMKLTWIHFTESSQVLQREREKDVGGLLQLFATMIGFVVMLIVQVCMVTLLFNVLHASLCTSVHHHQFTIASPFCLFCSP